MLIARLLSSFRITTTGSPADQFSSSLESKSAGKSLKPIFPRIFLSPWGTTYPQHGPEAELPCVPVYIFLGGGRWNGVRGQINVVVVQSCVLKHCLSGQETWQIKAALGTQLSLFLSQREEFLLKELPQPLHFQDHKAGELLKQN